MADMFVHILVENLKELMRSEHPIIGSKRNQATLEFLHNNVYVMSNFLKRTELEKCSAEEEVKLLLMEIRDVTYEVENYVDSFVQEAILAGREHADGINRILLNAKLEAVRIGVDHMNAKLDQSKLTLKKKRVNSEAWRQDAEKMLRKLIEAVKIGVDLSKLTLKKTVMAARYRSADDIQFEMVKKQIPDWLNSSLWSSSSVSPRKPVPGDEDDDDSRLGSSASNSSPIGAPSASPTNYTPPDPVIQPPVPMPPPSMRPEPEKVEVRDTMDKLLSRLTNGSKSMEVISIVGSPGIGKSTVAQRVFDHGRIKSTFPIRAWSTVSQTYDCKRLLIDILQSSSLFEDGDDASTADQLGEALLKRLKGKRYLVVLDDVWSIEAWNDIQRSFPDQHNGSRVLFTSRFAAIGKDVSDDINTHYMRGLSEEHSWNLLKNKVFGDKGQCPPELEESGMEIVRKCDGLPLAIVVTGGLLAKKNKNPEFWEQVASNLAPALATDQEASFMNTIALSYQHLPVHLKACFLYLGSFPLEFKLSLRSLIWLLIAEGFVIQETEEKSLEVTAEGYLNELVEWSLVTVAKKRSCGAMKAVRIHDLLRVFCVARGNQEKFNTTPYEYFVELLWNDYSCRFQKTWDQIWASILEEQCRLDCYHYRPSNVRSFCSEALYLSRPFFQGLGNLVHLRYFSSGDIYGLGMEFVITKLLNLETLFLDVGDTLDLPYEVWNMVKLRHLYNKNKRGMFHFPPYAPQGAVLENLQTLHTLCACDSCLTMLVRAPNIRKLGLSEYRRCPPGWPDVLNLCFLKQLETLMVVGPIWSWKAGIFQNLELPASLRKLTLRNTFLRWENISFLEQLPNLEVLKLLVNAFSVEIKLTKKTDVVNAYWDTSEVDFPKLKYLKMQRLDIVKWEDQDLQFESLEVLVLEKCFQLETIPFDLAGCPSLQTIDVRGCPTLVGELAKEIEVEHENMYGNSNLQVFITDPYVFLES